MDVLQRKRRRDYRLRQVPPVVWVLLALAAALLFGAVTAQVSKGRLNDQITATREQLAVRIQNNLNQALTSFDEMGRKNIDGQRQLLPEVKRYLYTADLLNDMLRDGYGDNYSLMDENLYALMESAMAEYERLLTQGQSAAEVHESLSAYMEQISSVLNTRFGVNGMILPKTAMKSQNPG